MSNPLGFLITFATYGTWLPGDARGWVDYQRGWQYPIDALALQSRARMVEHAKLLSPAQRQLVEQQIRETCNKRSWTCHAVNCRTNHVHAVISAPNTPPKRIRADLKAWCTRCLKAEDRPHHRTHWWADRGSVRWIWDESSLNGAIEYTENQDLHHAPYPVA